MLSYFALSLLLLEAAMKGCCTSVPGSITRPRNRDRREVVLAVNFGNAMLEAVRQHRYRCATSC